MRFSVLCDETTDISNQKQFSVCIRWINISFTIHEDVVGLVHVVNIKGELLFLSPRASESTTWTVSGQAYVGAANMQG